MIYLEIGPLKEGNYTGIAQVTAALAEEMLGDTRRDVEFFFGRTLVDRAVVEDVLARRNGELLQWHLGRAGYNPAPRDAANTSAAIFPNRKTCRRGFAVESQIIHDLSTLLTPQFHNSDTIDFHALTFLDDVRTNDLTFCVSEATRQDVLHYLGPLDPKSVVTVPLAASLASEADEFSGRDAEPFVLVLGTIEPRKNVGMVLRYLARNRAVLSGLRFLFLGRFGWGEDFGSLLRQYDLVPDYEANRILFPGFVSEQAKNALLRRAKLLVYPSLFEGFGLPVVESLSMGVPAVTTRSSSLPEVGGECCYYFDPFTEGDFDVAFARGLLDLQLRGDEVRRRCKAQAETFAWPRFHSTVMTAIDAELAKQKD